MNAKAAGIYAITNSQTGAQYIGQSMNIWLRWNEHRKHLRRGKHHSRHLQASWVKYGEPSFRFSVLENCEVTDLTMREQFWIDQSAPALNHGLCADNAFRGLKHSEETKQKMREANREHLLAHNSAQKGRPKSPETIERMRAAAIGRVLSEETKAKIGAAHRGKMISAEQRLGLSIAHKGVPRPRASRSAS